MTLDDLPLLLTVEEAAKLMRVSRNGAYNAVAEGAVPSIRIGRNIRIPRDALASILGINRDQAGRQMSCPARLRDRREAERSPDLPIVANV